MIGKLGRQVSRIGFGGFRVNNVTHGEALRKAIVSGVNIVDTAANFEKGKSSAYLGQDVSVLELKKFVVAKYGAEVVILAGRKQDALDDPMKKKDETPSANLRSLILHLASLESVKNAAAEVNAYAEPIDVLINNAAIMASLYYTTKDGFEAQIGTNHLGPFLFTNLIIPRILASNKNPRIVNVSSVGHIFSPIRFNDPFFENGKSYDKWKSYGQSKTANILFARELSKRYASERLTAFSLHPGGIQTNLGRDVKEHELSEPLYDHDATLTWKTTPEGTSTHLVAAFDPSIKSQSGAYLEDCQLASDHLKPFANDDAQANQLWALSEKLVG
ncbi:unnamed protein product [Umbelopsis vinacea]